MPQPTPNEDEAQDVFMARCVSDETMNSEYPEQDQRVAICLTQWREKHPEAPPAPERDAAPGEGQDQATPPEGERAEEAPEGEDAEEVERAAAICVCTECGYETKREGGIACHRHKCPECGGFMASPQKEAGVVKQIIKEAAQEVAKEEVKKGMKAGVKGFLQALTGRDAAAARVSRTVDMATLEVAADTGAITGYAVTWAFDGDGLRFTRGCFDKSIKERAGKIPLLIGHAAGGSSIFETVGFLTELKEDEIGLLVTGTFLDTERGQAAREQAIKGGVKAMSLQARPIQHSREAKTDVLIVSEAALMEVTLTNTPMDVGATIVAVRDGVEPPPPAIAARGAGGEPLPTEPPVITDTPEAQAARAREIALLELGGV